ncbi:MAG: dinitrogenase iron-molybdenum cofactor biosynthesis protein [Thermodesulfobacteriota bacterium]|nr:dinitrogenase iron-molybdenum cofactor biosynthesis protein [Thermodesulfobacteriota bacterium]
MTKKLIIPLYGNDVAPRFDLSSDAVIVSTGGKGEDTEEKIVVLPQASAEQLCHLILTEGIEVVICGGIEEEYYQYLTWKRINVIDSVIGPWKSVLEQFNKGMLKAGDILYDKAG